MSDQKTTSDIRPSGLPTYGFSAEWARERDAYLQLVKDSCRAARQRQKDTEAADYTLPVSMFRYQTLSNGPSQVRSSGSLEEWAGSTKQTRNANNKPKNQKKRRDGQKNAMVTTRTEEQDELNSAYLDDLELPKKKVIAPSNTGTIVATTAQNTPSSSSLRTTASLPDRRMQRSEDVKTCQSQFRRKIAVDWANCESRIKCLSERMLRRIPKQHDREKSLLAWNIISNHRKAEPSIVAAFKNLLEKDYPELEESLSQARKWTETWGDKRGLIDGWETSCGPAQSADGVSADSAGKRVCDEWSSCDQHRNGGAAKGKDIEGVRIDAAWYRAEFEQWILETCALDRTGTENSVENAQAILRRQYAEAVDDFCEAATDLKKRAYEHTHKAGAPQDYEVTAAEVVKVLQDEGRAADALDYIMGRLRANISDCLTKATNFSQKHGLGSTQDWLLIPCFDIESSSPDTALPLSKTSASARTTLTCRTIDWSTGLPAGTCASRLRHMDECTGFLKEVETQWKGLSECNRHDV